MTPHLGPILFVPGRWKFWLNLCHVSPPTAPLFSQQMSLILYIYLKHKKQTNSNYCRWSSPKWEVLLIKYSSTLLLLWIYLATTSNATLFFFLFLLFINLLKTLQIRMVSSIYFQITLFIPYSYLLVHLYHFIYLFVFWFNSLNLIIYNILFYTILIFIYKNDIICQWYHICIFRSRCLYLILIYLYIYIFILFVCILI